jgi:GAF domain-containing protein/HAMP domain-containing protein
MDLQKDELSTLAAYHTAYDKYVQARETYLASVGAGTPDDQLGNQAVDLLAQARQQLARLIAVNNEFAQLSNQVAMSAYRQTLINMGLAFSLTLLLGLAASFVIARSITRRLGSLADAASSVQQGSLTLSSTVTGQDEIAKLSKAFNAMTTQLRDLIGTLEQRVAERTRVAEQRATQIAAGAQVARVATSVLDPEQLVTQVVTLIQERFGFYYVGLFTVDESGRYAVLRQGTGEAGWVLRESKHRLEVGGNSMVGWVCDKRQARIALDAGQDAVRFANPLLPDTRSEIALPLQVGDRVLGALDVQSTQTAAFDENDIAVLQGMADQIATAMENARLFQQSQKALQERDSLSGLLVRQGWQDYLTQMQSARSAEFGETGTQPAGPDSKFTLRIPLELRGQTLGTLVMERSGDGQPWQTDEAETIRAVAQQATLALDSARLFEEAQMTAARERLLNEITARIRSTTTLDGVLNSAVREISALTGASFAEIELQVTETDS